MLPPKKFAFPILRQVLAFSKSVFSSSFSVLGVLAYTHLKLQEQRAKDATLPVTTPASSETDANGTASKAAQRWLIVSDEKIDRETCFWLCAAWWLQTKHAGSTSLSFVDVFFYLCFIPSRCFGVHAYKDTGASRETETLKSTSYSYTSD